MEDEHSDDDKARYASMVDRMVAGEHRTLPPIQLIKYNDLLGRAWGWKRLVPSEPFIEPVHYINYLHEYYSRNHLGYVTSTVANQDPEKWPLDPASPVRQIDTTTGRGLVALAQFCLKNEEKLAVEWKIRMKAHTDLILPTKTIILSSIIKKYVSSVMHASEGEFSDTVAAALLCIAKEADLTYELLTRGANNPDYFISQSSEIRMCALSLMNSKSCHSLGAAAVMVGVTNEAKIMCEWMRSENRPLVPFSGNALWKLEHCCEIRCRTLDTMMRILQKSFFPYATGQKPTKKESFSRIAPGSSNGVAGPGKTRRSGGQKCMSGSEMMKCPSGRCLSSVGHSDGFGQKWLEAGGISNHAPLFCNGNMKDREGTKLLQRSANQKDFLENAWGWERLVPFNGSVDCSRYIDYLQEYYNCNSLEYVAGTAADQNPKQWPLDLSARAGKVGSTGNGLMAVAEFCHKMEEQLVSEWKLRVNTLPEVILPLNTIVESSLIHEHVHSIICAGGGEFSATAAAALLCIIKEAELMCELLRLGTKPTDDIVKRSSVIRMCALSLMDLNPKGFHSVAAAGAMVGVAKEAKMMCVSMCQNSKIVTFNVSALHEPGCMIRFRTLDVMISILQESFFPDNKESTSVTTPGSNGHVIAAAVAPNTQVCTSSYKYISEDESNGGAEKGNKVTCEEASKKTPKMKNGSTPKRK